MLEVDVLDDPEVPSGTEDPESPLGFVDPESPLESDGPESTLGPDGTESPELSLVSVDPAVPSSLVPVDSESSSNRRLFVYELEHLSLPWTNTLESLGTM